MTPQRVVVIEDEADIRELVEYNFARAGFQVSTFENGELAGTNKAFAEKPVTAAAAEAPEHVAEHAREPDVASGAAAPSRKAKKRSKRR